MTMKSIYKVLNQCNLRKNDLVFDIGVGTLRLLAECASITETNVYGNELEDQFQSIKKIVEVPSKPATHSSSSLLKVTPTATSPCGQVFTPPSNKSNSQALMTSSLRSDIVQSNSPQIMQTHSSPSLLDVTSTATSQVFTPSNQSKSQALLASSLRSDNVQSNSPILRTRKRKLEERDDSENE